MQQTLVVFIQLFVFIFGKECLISQDNSTSVLCTNSTLISNITEIFMRHFNLIDMPDLSDYKQLESVYLDHNHIELITNHYLTIKYLSLTSNRIYALHQTNLTYPNLEYLDLSYNPIEHIAQNYFSNQRFPRLKILKLINTFQHINPYIIDERLISFSSLDYLNEIYFDDNHFEEFYCSKTTEHIQWILPINLKKISLRTNRLTTFDGNCLLQMLNLTELDFHSNHLKSFPAFNLTLPSLVKLQLDENSFPNIPIELLQSSSQLTELDLSQNPMNMEEIQLGKQPIFPSHLKILYLNEIKSDLSCKLFENLLELEQLYLINLTSIRLENCLFKKLTNLKMLNLSNHHLKQFDEAVFRPLLTLQQLDIASKSLRCNSCSLKWLNDYLKIENKTLVTCLDQQEQRVLFNTLNLLPCSSSSSNIFSIIMIITLILVVLISLLLLFIYLDKQRKYQFASFQPVYHMIPLRHYHDRIYQETTEDITNDNVMLVT